MLGDVAANVEKLKGQLRMMKFPLKDFMENGVQSGRAIAFLPILHYIFLTWCKSFSEFVRSYELQSKSDLRFVEEVYKILRKELGYRPTLTTQQFFSNGFAERKVMFVQDVIRACRKWQAETGNTTPKTSQCNSSLYNSHASKVAKAKFTAKSHKGDSPGKPMSPTGGVFGFQNFGEKHSWEDDANATLSLAEVLMKRKYSKDHQSSFSQSPVKRSASNRRPGSIMNSLDDALPATPPQPLTLDMSMELATQKSMEIGAQKATGSRNHNPWSETQRRKISEEDVLMDNSGLHNSGTSNALPEVNVNAEMNTIQDMRSMGQGHEKIGGDIGNLGNDVRGNDKQKLQNDIAYVKPSGGFTFTADVFSQFAQEMKEYVDQSIAKNFESIEARLTVMEMELKIIKARFETDDTKTQIPNVTNSTNQPSQNLSGQTQNSSCATSYPAYTSSYKHEFIEPPSRVQVIANGQKLIRPMAVVHSNESKNSSPSDIVSTCLPTAKDDDVPSPSSPDPNMNRNFGTVDADFLAETRYRLSDDDASKAGEYYMNLNESPNAERMQSNEIPDTTSASDSLGVATFSSTSTGRNNDTQKLIADLTARFKDTQALLDRAKAQTQRTVA